MLAAGYANAFISVGWVEERNPTLSSAMRSQIFAEVGDLTLLSSVKGDIYQG